MTTDNQTIEVPESVKDVDAYCLARQKIYLQTLVRRYNEYKNVKEFKEYCENNLSNQEIEKSLHASGYSNIEELPIVVEDDTKTLLSTVLRIKSSEFDQLINSLKQSTSDFQKNLARYNEQIEELERGLIDLKAKLSSNTNELLSRIDELKELINVDQLDVSSSEYLSKKYKKDFIRELVILCVAFVIGFSQGSLLGAIVTTLIVSTVREFTGGMIFFFLWAYIVWANEENSKKFSIGGRVRHNELLIEELNTKVDELPKLQDQEYQEKEYQNKLKEDALNEELRKAEDVVAYRLSMVLEFIKILKRQNELSLGSLTKYFLDFVRLTSTSCKMQDHLVDVNGKDLDIPSWQVTPSWQDFHWWKGDNQNSYKPRIEGLAPAVIRIGKLHSLQQKSDNLAFELHKFEQMLQATNLNSPKLNDLPFLLQCRISDVFPNKSGHIVIFSNSPETRQAAIAALESIALRAIATFPARKLQGIFIDPVSMGNTFPFRSLPEEIRGKRTYTTSDDIQEQLHKLIGHTEQVIQNYLSRDYDNIEAYNAAAEAIQEAYRYLFIADFPSKFDNKSFEYLNSLLVNGSRAGVYTIIHIDETLEKPRNFNYELFKAHCQILRPAGKSYNGEPLFVYEFSEATAINAKKDDTQLAGDDEVKLQIVNYIVKALLITYGVDLRKDQSALQRLNEAAKMAKIELSTVGVTEINLPFTIATQEGPLHLEISLNRSQFKQIYSNLPEYSNLPDRSHTSNENSGIVMLCKCYATLDKPPESDRFNQLTAMISKACGEVKVDTVAFSQLYPETLWTSDSRGEIRTAIGVAGAREKLEFWLGQNPKGLEVSQSLLFGKPGAGKSYTLHSIINGLAMRYAPDELELYLLDFKEGVEFQVYVDPDRGEDSGSSTDLDLTKALPHAKVISIESDREFGLSVLRKVNEQFQIRANEWKSVSNDITKVAEYRNKTNGKKMPRILIVIDEFQVLFEDNDSISAELNQIFDTIVKKGRAFGIHLLLASQSPNIKNITRSVYDLIDLRMAMQMNQNVAAMTLAEGNTDAVDLLDRPGRIIYNSDFGRKGSNEIGQVADASTDQRKKALRKIQETVQATGYQRPPTDQLVVFDGRHPTRLRNNGLLTVLASADTWLSPADIKESTSRTGACVIFPALHGSVKRCKSATIAAPSSAAVAAAICL